MEKIAIVGLGVIGGSFAKALKLSDHADYYVMGIDTDTATLKKAKESGVIIEGESQNKSILERADIVILALYPEAIKEFIIEHANEFKDGAILTDTAGIKTKMIEDIKPIIPEQVDFVFGHPMAGRESQGFDYSDHTAFIGANYIITPTDQNKDKNIDRIEQLVRSIGFQRVTKVSAEQHDQTIAHTSQLCHVIATTLINSNLDEDNTIQFVADSYMDLTRIANINDKLWSELMINNREALLENMDYFEKQWNVFKEALMSEDKELIEESFQQATDKRQALEKGLRPD